MTAQAAVALVLHGHLPHAEVGNEHDRLGERWLLEALWECYLPLEAMLDRLGAEGVPAAITLSITPPLGSMLRHPRLRRRLAEHLAALSEVNALAGRRFAADPALAAVCTDTAARLRWSAERWDALGGDLLAALERHRTAGRVDLLGSTATHAFLPGLTPEPGAVRAQLRLGLRGFERLCGHRPVGLWLPECGYDERLGTELARAGVGYTVLDAHGLSRARPRPPDGTARPVLGPGGVAYFGRDQAASHQVWSRAHGYPGDPLYREFYRDLGYELDEHELAGLGAGLMTGLKLHRITGPDPRKEPYQPALAARRAREHAAHFVDTCAERLAPACGTVDAPILVAAYDAELFGHWWHEGPTFLEQVLRRLAEHPALHAVTLGEHLGAHPRCSVVEPASSSWGEGGHGRAWLGPHSAGLWRHIHQLHRRVAAAVEKHRQAAGLRGLALDQAIRESLLAQASDWPFMLHAGPLRDYARARLDGHLARAGRWLAVVEGDLPIEEHAGLESEAAVGHGLLHELSGVELRDGFDP